jgi:uncharacterized protein
MELINTFTVPVPVDEAWQVMLDIAKFAPCMPGATVDEVRGDDVLGRVRVKLGPVSITYQGKVTFAEKDEEKHRVVLDAAARETRGSGTASARITAVMTDVDGSTEVSVTTDLSITGRPAQFGRGVMSDVSERIMNEFAVNLARELNSERLRPAQVPATAQGAPAQEQAATVPPRASAGSLDLLQAAGAPVLKRLVPALAALLALAGILILRRVAKGRS